MDSSDIYTNKKEELELKGEEKSIDYTIPATAVGKTEEIIFSETEQVITGRNVGRSISSPIDLGEETLISEGDNKIDFQQYRLTNIKEPEEDSDAVTKNYVDTHLTPSLTAGDNITIVDNVISATDTTYSDFTGTDGVDPGTSGLVPAPATTDAGKYLKADGTWDTVAAGPTVVQTTGTSTTDVMSQKAATNLVYPDDASINKARIAIGSGASTSNQYYDVAIGHSASTESGASIAIGRKASASGAGAMAIGQEATATGSGAMAIGYYGTQKPTATGTGALALGMNARATNGYSTALGHAKTTREHEVAVGEGTGTRNPTCYIANVTDPELPQDAATKNYVDTLFTYSSSEQEIGKWIDGKTLYRMVYEGTVLTNEVTVATLTGITAIKVSAWYYNDDGFTQPIGQGYGTSTSRVFYDKSQNALKIQATGGLTDGSFYARTIIEYTKDNES